MVELIGGREVKVFPWNENWFRANEICAAHGMELLINYNLEENNHCFMFGGHLDVVVHWKANNFPSMGIWPA